MAKEKKEQEKADQPGKPSDKFIVTAKGFHGRLLRTGQEISRGQLIALGGFVPGYCKPVGTPEAKRAVDDSEGDDDGFKNNDERVRFLAVKGIHVTARLGKVKLQELILKASGGESPRNSGVDIGQGASSAFGQGPPSVPNPLV